MFLNNKKFKIFFLIYYQLKTVVFMNKISIFKFSFFDYNFFNLII